MKTKVIFKIILTLLVCTTFISCTEQYIMQTNTFEDALVVEAKITNELKKQEIKLTRTYRLEDAGPTFETGANIYVTDNIGNQYNFSEQNEIYKSENEFKAEVGRNYTLHITTSNGKNYISNPQSVTTESPITDAIPSIVTKENGDKGIQINVKSFDPTSTSKYYRYEYEETYKIIAPKWVLSEAKVTGYHQITLVPKTTETRTCYSTKKSTEILLTNTAGQNQDRVDFPVRFLSNQNYIISHRYSILVKQYVENLEAYTFNKTLKDLSGEGSILSQNQPGLLTGNIKNTDNPNETVIGYFEVASVSSKRIFFNYTDFFPLDPLPPYYTDCTEQILNFCFLGIGCSGDQIIEGLESHSLIYSYRDGLVYHMYVTPCGDCTSFSSNIIPSFWTN